jgi:hypothetical protein
MTPATSTPEQRWVKYCARGFLVEAKAPSWSTKINFKLNFNFSKLMADGLKLEMRTARSSCTHNNRAF